MNEHKAELVDFAARVDKISADDKMRRLFELTGSVKFGHLMKMSLDGAMLCVLAAIREDETFKLLPSAKPGGGKMSWEEFCETQLGMSKRYVNELMQTERELGPGFNAAADRLGIGRRQVRLLLRAPDQIKEDIRGIVEDPEHASDDQIRMAVDDLTARVYEMKQQQEATEEKLHARIDQQGVEIERRKKAQGKLENEARELQRQVREARAGWEPSEETDQATHEILIRHAQIQQLCKEIQDQCAAVADWREVHPYVKTVALDLVQSGDGLLDKLRELAGMT